MATIISDGPREWAADMLDRKLGRLVGAAAGLVLILGVFAVEPGWTRRACAVGGPVLVARSALPGRATRTEDLVELEAIIMSDRAEVAERLDGITDLVVEIGDQVR
jgi:hypothetical protein